MGRLVYLNGHGFQFIHINNNNEYAHLVNILESGNVGIGTYNPDERLTVKGKIHAEEVKNRFAGFC